MKYALEPGRKITAGNTNLGVICLEAKRTTEMSEGERGAGGGGFGEGCGEGACEGGRESVTREVGRKLVFLTSHMDMDPKVSSALLRKKSTRSRGLPTYCLTF